MITKQLTHHQVHWLENLCGFNYLIHYCAGWLGTKPDALTHSEVVYPCGENAYTLANPHNFQSMFKAGQLLRVIILNSASLLLSIQHGLQTDLITESHLTCLRVGPDSTTTVHATASPDPWSLSQYGDFATRDCSMFQTTRMSNWISFVPTITIAWLDTQALPRQSRTSIISSIGPKWWPSSLTTSIHAWSAVPASPYITSPL